MSTASAPTQIVILGGSGDLSKRKLLPALLDLYVKNALPDTFRVVGVARTPRNHEEFRRYVEEALEGHGHKHSKDTITKFCTNVEYVPGSFDEPELYTKLGEEILKYNNSLGACTNTLFYLAVPPQYYETIFRNLHDSGLSKPCSAVTGWTRVLVEKPFGHDRKSAEQLDSMLSSLFREEQIFRIDHYLAKEAIQNILSFRFANTLTKNCWNKSAIEAIDITMHETVDIGERGAFYDGIGALRDVGQNHLLQLLALVTMEEPKEFTPNSIRKERAKILEKLIPLGRNTITNQYRRGSYEHYAATAGVNEKSETETGFWLRCYLDDPDWKDVPITLETGKALKEKRTEVRIRFKDVATGLFETETCKTVSNEIVLTIDPERTMEITLNAKAPGLGFQVESRTLSFTCSAETSIVKNAYEKVLVDCIEGDQTLFISSREIAAQWNFINSIISNQSYVPLETYPRETNTPFNS